VVLQVLQDRFGTALRQQHVVPIGTADIRVALDFDHRTVSGRVRELSPVFGFRAQLQTGRAVLTAEARQQTDSGLSDNGVGLAVDAELIFHAARAHKDIRPHGRIRHEFAHDAERVAGSLRPLPPGVSKSPFPPSSSAAQFGAKFSPKFS
jgi:hypothetical protein